MLLRLFGYILPVGLSKLFGTNFVHVLLLFTIITIIIVIVTGIICIIIILLIIIIIMQIYVHAMCGERNIFDI